MPVSITAKTFNSVNGDPNDADEVSQEFTDLHNNDSNLKTATDNLMLGNIEDAATLTLNSAYTGSSPSSNGVFQIERGTQTNMVIRWNETNDNWEAMNDGTNYVIFGARFSADPSSPTNGGIWYNTTGNELKARINGSTVTLLNSGSSLSYPRSFNATAIPVTASTTTITVASIACRDSSNAADITKAGSTTVDITTTGINGIAQSSNLTGTIAVSSGGTSVTGTSTTFTTDYVVGDVITTAGGQSRRITVISSNTSITVESTWSSNETGVTYKRGGRAPSTHYYLYAITDGSTPGLILATRSVSAGNTLVDMPSGYTYSRQLAYEATTNSSSNLLFKIVVAGWPYKPRIAFRDSENASPYQMLTAGSSTTAFSNPGGGSNVTCSSIVPPGATSIWFHAETAYIGSAGTFISYLKNPDSTVTTGEIVGIANSIGQSYTESHPECTCNSSQQVAYRCSTNNISLTLNVKGYTGAYVG